MSNVLPHENTRRSLVRSYVCRAQRSICAQVTLSTQMLRGRSGGAPSRSRLAFPAPNVTVPTLATKELLTDFSLSWPSGRIQLGRLDITTMTRQVKINIQNGRTDINRPGSCYTLR